MNRIATYLFVCVALCGLISAADRKIAYEHDEKIFVANVDGTHAKKIADGALPEISPDGTRIAFNTEFLCIIQKKNENQASIYRIALDGKNPKLLVKHARTPSVSAP